MMRALAVSVLVVGAAACGADSKSGAGHAGQLLACPGDAPSGSCPAEGMTCEYPTQSCQCIGGDWSCIACPAAQPDATTSLCPLLVGTSIVPLACTYGALTCTCVDELGPPKWRCGACPASAPAQGAACGNSSFSCAYADQSCTCSGGTWMCSPTTCPPLNLFGGSCTGVYTCAYPDQDQICSCNGPLEMQCSCPANLPPNGGACAPASCRYGDQICDCQSSGWMCMAACPTDHPTAGSACSTDLSCTYSDGVCYCSGGTWHC
jgi:hypothetical protein